MSVCTKDLQYSLYNKLKVSSQFLKIIDLMYKQHEFYSKLHFYFKNQANVNYFLNIEIILCLRNY